MKIKIFTTLIFSAFIGFYFTTGIHQSNREYTLKDFIKWKIEKKKHQKPNYGSPDEAMKMDYEKRTYPLGYIPQNWRSKALNFIEKNKHLEKSSETNALAWTQLGPGNVPGRTRSIVIDPDNADVIYSGSVSGGVWKSTNAGNTWFPLKDNMENLAVCSMVMDPTDSKILYAGTGEGYYNTDVVRGEGIFKTTDNGNSWTQLSSTINENFYYVNKLVIDKTTNVLWAATRKGLFFSNDGGTTFSPRLNVQGGGDAHCMDVEIAYTTPSSIYASFGQFNESVIFKSSNGGNDFSQNYSKTGHGRIEIGVSSNNPSVVYASFLDLNTMGVGHFTVTTDGGINWNEVTIPGPSLTGLDNYAGTQAWYDNILAVDPDNSNTVYVGGIDFWKSTDQGKNWKQKTLWVHYTGYEYAHADQHAIVFHPDNPNILYLGTDGGVFRSTDKGETWNNLHNNLFTTQFYYGAVDPVENKFYGGSQDNGTLKSDGTTEWHEILGGDGGVTEVDFDNPDNVYMEYTHLCFYKSTDGGANYTKRMNGIPSGTENFDGTTDRVLFIAPFSIDPNDSKTLVAGTYRVFKTTDGAENWTSISGDLTGDGTGTEGSYVSTVVIAKGNSNVIYAGCSNGKIQVTTNNGTNWNLRNTELPQAYCSRIAAYPNDPASAIAVFSGFLENKKVFRTTNYGVSWTNISNDLPNIPVNCIFINPNDRDNLFIGTDLGVFSSTNSGANWVIESNLPKVRTDDLDYRTSDNKLFAATHGRSMFAAQLSGSGAAVAAVDASQINLSAKPNQTGKTSFVLSNNGGKNLDFTISLSSPFENIKKLTIAESNNGTNKPSVCPNINKFNTLPKILGGDLLILDDGNNDPDSFLGFNNGIDFGWANKFDLLDNGFKLEGFQVYERSEDAFVNTIYASVYDKDLNFKTGEYFYLDNSKDGKWFSQSFSSPIEFQDGESFYLLIETFFSGIDFPAGCDYNGQVKSNSFYMNYDDSSLVNINTVSGFENGAFLIRAVGTITAGSNENPVAVANLSTHDAVIGQNINFDASDSYDNDGQVTSYLWNFGDGSTSNQKIIDHSYSQKNKYTYTLNVTDNEGATDQTDGEINVKDTANISPVAVADVSKQNGLIGESIKFDASNSHDDDGEIVGYLWNFGDGETGSNKIEYHSYSQKGTFNYTLKVTDNKGAIDQTGSQITIKDTVTYLSVDPSSGTIPPGGSVSVTVHLNAAGLPEGNYQGVVSIKSNGGNINIPIDILISQTVDVADKNQLPKKITLFQNYPNPFNPNTNIKFEIPQSGLVNLEVFDISGRKISTLVNQKLAAGTHQVIFDGSNLASGIYLYRLISNESVDTKKFILLK